MALPSPAAERGAIPGYAGLTIHVAQSQPAGIFELRDSGEPVTAVGRTTDAALLLFTSATTDSPKLVPLTWSNLHAMAVHDSRALQLTAADRLLSLMPLFHLHGLATVLTQLSCGGSVISTAGFEPCEFSGVAHGASPYLVYIEPALESRDPRRGAPTTRRFSRSSFALYSLRNRAHRNRNF